MTRFLQSILGLLLGAGFGVVVGFITFAIMDKFNPSTFVIFLPSGSFRVGIMGGLLIGLVGGVIGLITGAFGLRSFHGAGVGIVIYALLKARRVYSDEQISIEPVEAALVLNLALIGALVSLSLPTAAELLGLSRARP
ncbi:MAG: hypothetical protein ABR594_11920 [Pyrinomonadaceae bacterium]